MKLRPYQIEGRNFLARRTRALLADEMRVGKTPQAILAAEQIEAQRVLVIAPASATVQWQHEWVRWAGRRSQVLLTNQQPSSSVAIASYDRAVRNKEILASIPWDLLIVDESHYLKNPGAERTRAILAKKGIAYSAARLWLLSGTPMPKNASEIWIALRCFGVTQMSYGEWVGRYCRLDEQNQRIVGNSPLAAKEIPGLLDPIMLRREFREVAPHMPPIGVNPLFQQPARKVQLFDLPAGATDEQLMEWLAKQGPNQGSTRTEVAMAKVPALAETILDAFEGGLTRTVVFGYHIPPMQEMKRRLESGGLKVEVIDGSVSSARRFAICNEFHEGLWDVVLVQIIAGREALDLSAARHGYALEIDWVPGNNWQAWNRLRNMAKADPVTIDVVTLPGTSDEAINRVVARRAAEVQSII